MHIRTYVHIHSYSMYMYVCMHKHSKLIQDTFYIRSKIHSHYIDYNYGIAQEVNSECTVLQTVYQEKIFEFDKWLVFCHVSLRYVIPMKPIYN